MATPRDADLQGIPGTPAVAAAPRRAVVLVASAMACCYVLPMFFVYVWPLLTVLPPVRALPDPLYELLQSGWLVAFWVGGIVGMLLARHAQRLIPPAYASSGRVRERLVAGISAYAATLAWVQAILAAFPVVLIGLFIILDLTGVWR